MLGVDAAACPETAASLLYSEPTSEMKNVRNVPCFGAETSL